jgi:transcriptional regulator with XRE-family HTH domain
MNIKLLGRDFEKARKESGLTQASLAKLAGLSRQTVSDFERGSIEDLGIAKVERLLNLVGLSLGAQPMPQKPKDWLGMAARSAGARYSNPPTKDQLGDMLAHGNAKLEWKTHVRQVLEEFPAVAFPGLARQIGSEFGIGPRNAWRNLEKLAKDLDCYRIGGEIGT